MPKVEIKWQAPEFSYKQKGVSWYWISMILAIIVLALAIWQKNFLFGFFIILAEILLMIWANRMPPLIDFALTEKDMSVGGKIYHLSDIENFSSDANEESEWPNLFFEFKSRLRPILKIKVPQSQAETIENALKAVLKKTERKSSFLDTLEEFIGF